MVFKIHIGYNTRFGYNDEDYEFKAGNYCIEDRHSFKEIATECLNSAWEESREDFINFFLAEMEERGYILTSPYEFSTDFDDDKDEFTIQDHS